MNQFHEYHKSDLKRLEWNNRFAKRFSYFHRKAQFSGSPITRTIYRLLFKAIKSRHGIEMSYSTKIGKGLRLMHPENITIVATAVLGDNIDLYKGVTIGAEWRGKRKGVPTIGNSVWIGANSTVCGRIHIGDDVLIAPNTLVNRDVPSHSIVVGCPCIVISKDNATEHYIVNKA